MVMSNTKLDFDADKTTALDTKIKRQRTMLNKLRIEVEQTKAQLRKTKKDLRDLDIQRIFESQKENSQQAAQTEKLARAALKRMYQLSRYNQHDVLTGTPNRALTMDRLENAIILATRNSSQMAVLFVDIDRFKSINDQYGHDMGDKVLRCLSERMVHMVRQSDTVSRHGGDEFLILLPEIQSPNDALIIANKVIAATSQNFDLDGHTLALAISIGIALFPEHATDPQGLIRVADKAMYQAKRNGGKQCQFGLPSTDNAGGTE